MIMLCPKCMEREREASRHAYDLHLARVASLIIGFAIGVGASVLVLLLAK